MALNLYLLSRYFVGLKGGGTSTVELDGLTKIYDNLQTLNRHIAKRLRAASKTDSAVNALVILDLYAIDDALDTLEALFSQYIKAGMPD